MFVAPAGRDNHVTVDPVTGYVHCTVDDQGAMYSDRGEILYTFAPDGTDLTDPSPSMVGLNFPNPDPYNVNGTMAFAVWNGSINATQFRRDPNGNFINHVVCESPAEEQWVTSYWPGQPGPNGFQDIAVDGAHVVLAGPEMVVFDVNGWYMWQTDQAGGTIALFNDIIYSPNGGQIRRFQVSDGTALSPFPGPANGFVQLAIDAANLYWGQVNMGSLNASAITLNGGSVYDVSVVVDGSYTVRSIAVDINGRSWISLNSYMDTMPDVIARVEPDGSTVEFFGFGYRINDLASDGEMLYITGQLGQNTDETFLIGVDVSMPTGIIQQEEQLTTLWPNPAQDLIRLGNAKDRSFAEILDARGRIIRKTHLTGSDAIDVRDLEQGVYQLRLRQEATVQSLPFVIAR